MEESECFQTLSLEMRGLEPRVDANADALSMTTVEDALRYSSGSGEVRSVMGDGKPITSTRTGVTRCPTARYCANRATRRPGATEHTDLVCEPDGRHRPSGFEPATVAAGWAYRAAAAEGIV